MSDETRRHPGRQAGEEENGKGEGASPGSSDEEREVRKELFSRRALVEWSVPVILSVAVPSSAHAQSPAHSDSHEDVHFDSERGS